MPSKSVVIITTAILCACWIVVTTLVLLRFVMTRILVRFEGNWSEYSLNGTAYLDRPGCYEFSAYVDRAKDGSIVLYPHEGFRWVGNRPTSSSKCKTVLRPVPAAAAADYAERDMTCRGPLYGSGIYNIGTCYIHNDMFSYNDVVRWCEDEKPCVVRARVVPRGTPSGMPQSYTIVKVYSARRPRR